MPSYTPLQRAYYASRHRDFKGGSVREGTASIMRGCGGTLRTAPLESVPDAELEITVVVRKPPYKGLVRVDGSDLSRVLVVHPYAPAPPLQLREIAAVVRRCTGDRKLGVRDTGEHHPDKPRARIFEVGAFELPDEPELGDLPGAPVRAVAASQPESEPVRAIGRADFTERREARVERLEHASEKAAAEARTREAAAMRIANVMQDQPILVGHHSEKRHRRDIARRDRDFRKAHEQRKLAAELERAADVAARNDAISADDPEALVKLHRKLEALERERERIKALNARCRKGDVEAQAIVRADVPVFYQHQVAKGYPSYHLTNLGATIRTVAARIAQLRREAARPERAPIERGGWEVTENRETNRVEIRTPGRRRCSHADYRELKSRGFKYSKTADAFVRLLNDSAWNTAEALVERFTRTLDNSTAAE